MKHASSFVNADSFVTLVSVIQEIATASTATSLLPFEALAGFVTIFFQGLLSDQN